MSPLVNNKDDKNSHQAFLIQGSILAVASIISRVIGLLYRSPMTLIIGDMGNDFYSTAYEVYSMMLLISSMSLPLAVSKLVSARMAKGEIKSAERVFKAALGFALISGAIACAIVFFGAEAFAALLKTPMAVFALKVLAPTLIIVAVLGVIRGFFQGLGNMAPSAVSQIVEQILNAIASIVGSYCLFNYGLKIGTVLGNTEKYQAAYGAAGGTLGTGIGALFGLAFMVLIYIAYRTTFKKKLLHDKSRTKESYGSIIWLLVCTIVPVLLSTFLYNFSSILNQGLFKNFATVQKYSPDEISIWWGVFSGKYRVLVNVPISIASALVSASVPAIASSYALGDKGEVVSKIGRATRFTMVIAFPCAVGMAALASPILQLLFKDSSELSAQMLMIGVISVVFYSLSTLSNGILQGINKMRVPVVNAIISLIAQAGFLALMMFAFRLNIYAVVWANVFFSILMCVLNQFWIRKATGYRDNILKVYILPLLCSAVMGVVVYFFYNGIMSFMKVNAVATILSIILGAVVYFVLMLLTKGMDRETLLDFPGGRKIAVIAEKLHLLRD